MTDPLPVVVFPDIEALSISFLASRLPDVHVTSEWPEDLAERLPVVAVSRLGGGTELRFVLQDGTIDIDCLAASKAAAHDLAQLVLAHMLTMPSADALDAIVYTVTDDGLVWAPDPVTELPRYVLTCTLRFRPA
ncbi:hypothetical protein [Embleya sp. NPDC005971]|uniref:hypothetical protein n=1 Tax=Embleya sp. NPDC005971 TaxID=3156724 RepID=UPI0034024B2A